MTLLDADKVQRLDGFGEDTCDLLCTIEVSFGIEFSSDELVSSTTIQKLGECISAKLDHPVSEQCLNAVVFYQLRRAFVDLFGTPRPRIDPGTRLAELMPWIVRRRRWRELQNHLGLVLPDLRCPIWLFGFSLAIAITLIVPIWTRASKGGLLGLLAALLLLPSAVLACYLVLRLLTPLARVFPRSCDDFGDLVRLTLARNYAAVASQRGRTSEREVLPVLRQLIAAETGVNMTEITPETRFPEGLNIY